MSQCVIENCGKDTFNNRGWCSAHYFRWRRHGDPLGGQAPYSPPGAAVKFLTETVLPFEDRVSCLTWPFTKDNWGYGRVNVNGNKHTIVSRYVCENIHGAPPTAKYEAAHSCGKGRDGCCNPWHLSWKTRAENEADKILHGTHNRGERGASAKLSQNDVLFIRQASQTRNVLAKTFGVSVTTIEGVQRRKTWAWLEESYPL